MTPTKWIDQMNVICIVSKVERYGGTYAHSNIAMSFATWTSSGFQLYIVKDYRRLKDEIKAGESANIEFKVEVYKRSEKYIKIVIAFANTAGGKIIIG